MSSIKDVLGLRSRGPLVTRLRTIYQGRNSRFGALVIVLPRRLHGCCNIPKRMLNISFAARTNAGGSAADPQLVAAGESVADGQGPCLVIASNSSAPFFANGPLPRVRGKSSITDAVSACREPRDALRVWATRLVFTLAVYR